MNTPRAGVKFERSGKVGLARRSSVSSHPSKAGTSLALSGETRRTVVTGDFDVETTMPTPDVPPPTDPDTPSDPIPPVPPDGSVEPVDDPPVNPDEPDIPVRDPRVPGQPDWKYAM